MRNMQVGVRVARQVRCAEHALDTAMIEVSRLIEVALESRVEARLAAQVGQRGLSEMVQTLGRLAEARGALVNGHEVLAGVAEEHGIGWRLEGASETKSAPAPAKTASLSLAA